MSEVDPTQGAAPDAAAEPEVSPGITLADLQAMQQAYRDDIKALRDELAATRKNQPRPELANAISAEDALANRLAEIDGFEYYCPGCGALYHYQRACVGLNGASPHPPIEVVSTDELKAGDPSQHTPAPATTT
jgi:hypothetical protein